MKDLAQVITRMERRKTRKKPGNWKKIWIVRVLFQALNATAGGMAETVRGNGIRSALATAACFVLLTNAGMPDGGRPFAVAAFAAQLLTWSSAPSAFIGCVIGVLLQGNFLSWMNWWQIPACAALWLSYPLWRGTTAQFSVRAAVAAGLAMLLPIPFLGDISGFARLQCALGAAVAAAVTPVFHQLAVLIQGRPRPLRNDERLCALLGMGALALGGLPWQLAGCNIGHALAACMTLLLAQSGGAGMSMLTGASLGLALVVGGSEPWIAVSLGAGGALAGGLGGKRRVTVSALFVLGAAVGALVLRGTSMEWFPLSSIALGTALYLLIPAGTRARLMQYATPANDEGIVRPEAVSAAFAHALESRANSLNNLSSVLPKPAELPMDMPDRLARLAELHCDGCARRQNCWTENYAETSQILGSLVEIAEERELDPQDVVHTVELIGCARAGWTPGHIMEMLEEERRLLAVQARQQEAHALAGVQFEGLSQCMQGIAHTLREETVFLPTLQRRIQKALAESGASVEVLTATHVCGKVEVLLHGQDINAMLELREAVARAAGVPVRPRVSDTPGQTEVLFEQETALDVEVGVTRRTKYGEEVAGDGHVVQRLTGGRQLMALSDGMGSGPKARRESQATLMMLRQCLGAGYTRAQALMAVNGLLLSCAGEDMFATMDLCLLDLHSGEVAFEKLGACTSYVVRGDTCRAIAGETLPLGILSSIRPRSYRMRLQEGDLVVMLSDGVADAYPAGDDGLMRTLAKLHTLPAQHIADSLLKKALAAQGDCPQDDMTVLCIRLHTQMERVMPLERLEKMAEQAVNRRKRVG